MNKITVTKFEDPMLFLVRIVVAIIFLFAGWAKISFWNQPPQGISPSMIYLIKFLSIVEPLGAIALIAGFLTRWAAAGLAIIMVGSIIILTLTMQTSFFTTPEGLGWDYNLIILVNCLTLVVFGGGRWSLDALLSLRKKLLFFER